jgi:septal ring factor EnvC (AmiA/AmiB activator)
MSKDPTKPSESLVQQLLVERRELKVTVERLRLELAEVQTTASGPDPRLRDLQAEIERLRYQLASARAEAGLMREERDELRLGVERALEQISNAGPKRKGPAKNPHELRGFAVSSRGPLKAGPFRKVGLLDRVRQLVDVVVDQAADSGRGDALACAL